MFRRPVNLLDIDRPDVEIEVPMWFVEMEEIQEAQEKAQWKLDQAIRKAEIQHQHLENELARIANEQPVKEVISLEAALKRARKLKLAA